MEELKNANKQLTIDVKKFQTLEEQRRIFFAAVSHKFKTPLTILKGQIENIIGNAVRHSPCGENVFISLQGNALNFIPGEKHTEENNNLLHQQRVLRKIKYTQALMYWMTRITDQLVSLGNLVKILLSLLGGLDSPSDGQVLFQGEDIEKKGLAFQMNKCVIVVIHSNDLAKQADVVLRLKKGEILQV